MSIDTACTNMIKQQLRTGDVLNEKILDLYSSLPRHEFVPSQFEAFAYSDMQIPLAQNQRMMTPLEEGRLLQALALTGNEIVLEVGTGSGFLTALLSRLAKKVISVDYYAEFTNAAAKKLAAHDCNNVELITGDACQGWLEKAPYDVIIFTSAVNVLTETHFLQVLPGGQLFAIVGDVPCMQAQLHRVDHNEVWQNSLVFETNIPPLVDRLKPKIFTF
jgi:protein-L-isoaspartate(D-aspartate) O-methyltransferase